jgi:hypothetical protein
VALVSARTGDGVAAAVDLVTVHAAALRHGPLSRRRRAQGRAWAESRLLESFGRVGKAVLAPRITLDQTPFTGLAEVTERARGQVHKALKDL